MIQNLTVNLKKSKSEFKVAMTRILEITLTSKME